MCPTNIVFVSFSSPKKGPRKRRQKHKHASFPKKKARCVIFMIYHQKYILADIGAI